MKKILFTLILLIAFSIGTIHFFALPKAKQQLSDHFQNIGLGTSQIDSATININGLYVKEILFDKDGFNHIKGLSAEIFWPSYIFKKDIKSVTIKKVQISNVVDTPQDILRSARRISATQLYNLPIEQVTIDNIILDTSTPRGAIRINAKTTLCKSSDGTEIKTTISGKQHQVSFSSNWKALIQNTTDINIEGTIDQLSINYAPLNLHRGTAWVSYNTQKDDTSLSAQLDSGNGKIFNIPAKNINLTIGKKDNYYPILFRAEASGINGVNLNTDIHYSQNTAEQIFDLNLNIDRLSDFVTYLKERELLKRPIDNLNNKKTKLTIKYLADKRFADGPLPFDLNLSQDSEKKLEGTFLIYPASLDLRGTANSEDDFRKLLLSFFDIPKENITDDTIRVESNLKSLLSE